MKLSTKIILGFSAVLLLFVVLVGINKIFSRYVQKDINWVNQTELILRASSDLQKQVEKMQSGLRGYLLSEDENFLQSFYQATSQFEEIYSTNANLIRPDPLQWQRYERIHESVKQYKDEYAEALISAKRDALADPSLQPVFQQLFENTFKKSVGKNMLDEIRQVFADFDDQEYLIRQQKNQDLQLSMYRIDTISVVLAVFMMLIAVGVTFIVTRHISVRINSMITVAETIARGNFNIQVKDDANDEMSRLGQALNRMTKAIQESFGKLEQANKELALTNKDLENFAYVASHDLKEPVRMISNYTQLLYNKYGNKMNDEAKEYISFAVEGSYRIRNLINDLLAYVQLTQNVVSVDKVKTDRLLEKVLQKLDQEIKNTNTRIHREKLPDVIADIEKLGILFMHLIDNAIKFRKQDVAPVITIKAQQELDYWIFSFADNGIGMDQQYQEKIFTIFQRLHRKEEYEGTGIGLTLCKKIVEMHGGQIWVESAPDKGTTIFFSLPSKAVNS